jgi:hypothetical protein
LPWYADRAGQIPVIAPIAIAAIVTVLAWPIAYGPARPGLDQSWHTALHLAAAGDLRQGVDLVFTDGPLGFLGFPTPYLGLTSSLALAASMAVYFGLVATMFLQARRALPLWAAAIVTLLVARIFVSLPPFEALQALVFLLSVEAIADRIPLPTPALAAGAGIIAGVAALGKLNVALFVPAMGAAAMLAIGRPWWKALLVFLAVAAATSLALWLAAGQRLSDLGHFLIGAYQIVSGYGEAMGLDVFPERSWIYLVLAVGALLLMWAGWRSSSGWPMRRRAGLALVGLIFAFSMWKLIIVREHATFATATATVAMFAFAGPATDRRAWLASVAALAISFAGVSSIQPSTYLNVVGSTQALVAEAKEAFIPGRGELAAQRSRDHFRYFYKLQPAIVAAIANQRVHIDPYETSIAAAYPEIHWAPLPVFQSYSAYTPLLDQLNADRLRSADAPDRILRQFSAAAHNDRLEREMGRPVRDDEIVPFTVDGRFRWFEAPATTIETFCRYTQIAQSGGWQVLARTDRACGSPQPLVTITAMAGAAIQVPAETRPDRFVIVRVSGLEPSVLGRLKTLLSKAPDWYVTLDGTRYRLVPGTVVDGLLVAVPPAADGTGNFAFGPPIRSMAIMAGLDGRESSATLTYEFLSVPMSAP